MTALRCSGETRWSRSQVGCRAAGAPRCLPLLWLALAVAAVSLAWLAIAAVKSAGLDSLLPKDQPFAPYFTTGRGRREQELQQVLTEIGVVDADY